MRCSRTRPLCCWILRVQSPWSSEPPGVGAARLTSWPVCITNCACTTPLRPIAKYSQALLSDSGAELVAGQRAGGAAGQRRQLRRQVQGARATRSMQPAHRSCSRNMSPCLVARAVCMGPAVPPVLHARALGDPRSSLQAAVHQLRISSRTGGEINHSVPLETWHRAANTESSRFPLGVLAFSGGHANPTRAAAGGGRGAGGAPHHPDCALARLCRAAQQWHAVSTACVPLPDLCLWLQSSTRRPSGPSCSASRVEKDGGLALLLVAGNDVKKERLEESAMKVPIYILTNLFRPHHTKYAFKKSRMKILVW